MPKTTKEIRRSELLLRDSESLWYSQDEVDKIIEEYNNIMLRLSLEQLQKELTALAIPNMVETKWNKDGDVLEYTNYPSVKVKDIDSVFDKVVNK
jgi:hypothetical protein